MQELTGIGSKTDADISEVQDGPDTVTFHNFTLETAPPKDKHVLKAPTLGQLLEATFSDRQHLLFPWLREQESCMVYAATGVGKSMFALSAALAIAGDGEFLGWKPDDRANGAEWRVLYIDGEMHIADIKERARMLMYAVPLVEPRESWREHSFSRPAASGARRQLSVNHRPRRYGVRPPMRSAGCN